MLSALLHDISKHITNENKLRCLGIELGLARNQVETIAHNRRGDINGAGYEVLSIWSGTLTEISEKEMREDLKNVLCSERVKIHLVVSECF